MADLLEKLHIDAGLNLLRADAGLVVYPNVKGFVPPKLNPPYVRVDTFIERPPADPGNSQSGLSTTWTVRWYCRAVASNEYGLAALAMRLRAALLDARPTILGRNCGPIRDDGSFPGNRDDATGPLVMSALHIYRMKTYG
jgi:hypothetical protein